MHKTVAGNRSGEGVPTQQTGDLLNQQNRLLNPINHTTHLPTLKFFFATPHPTPWLLKLNPDPPHRFLRDLKHPPIIMCHHIAHQDFGSLLLTPLLSGRAVAFAAAAPVTQQQSVAILSGVVDAGPMVTSVLSVNRRWCHLHLRSSHQLILNQQGNANRVLRNYLMDPILTNPLRCRRNGL